MKKKVSKCPLVKNFKAGIIGIPTNLNALPSLSPKKYHNENFQHINVRLLQKNAVQKINDTNPVKTPTSYQHASPPMNFFSHHFSCHPIMRTLNRYGWVLGKFYIIFNRMFDIDLFILLS